MSLLDKVICFLLALFILSFIQAFLFSYFNPTCRSVTCNPLGCRCDLRSSPAE